MLEVIAHGRAVGKPQLGAEQRKVLGVKVDSDFGNHSARAVGLGFQDQLTGLVGDRLRNDGVLIVQLGFTARKARLEQGQRVAPWPSLGPGEWESFYPLEARIENQQLGSSPDSNGLRRCTEFPPEVIRGGKPDMAGRGERLGQ